MIFSLPFRVHVRISTEQTFYQNRTPPHSSRDERTEKSNGSNPPLHTFCQTRYQVRLEIDQGCHPVSTAFLWIESVNKVELAFVVIGSEWTDTRYPVMFRG